MQAATGLYDPRHEHDACGLGIVANIDGRSEHGIVSDALSLLRNLEHRGAVGGDSKTGDGAGLLCRIPDAFFRAEFGGVLEGIGPLEAAEDPGPDEDKVDSLGGLPYGLGMFFLPREAASLKVALSLVEYVAGREGFEVLGWREVPVRPEVLGQVAATSMPVIRQAAFLRRAGVEALVQGEELERDLYILRRCIEREARNAGFGLDALSIPSLSSRTLVYKGMFVASQFQAFYPDLDQDAFSSPFAVVHQRYSTNTFPSWPLAQPFRMISHNGEINTLRKNMHTMRARETTLQSHLFGAGIAKLFPIIEEAGSDSAMFDNVYELLVRAGRSPEEAFMMMVPEPFGPDYHISADKRAFYEYHSAIMESWDGPAAMTFTDGIRVGAALDRNGLRPFRYAVTRGGRFVGASETGALELPEAEVLERGKLEPGKMILLDLGARRLIKDNELKSRVSRGRPYRRWLEKNQIELRGLFSPGEKGRGSDPGPSLLAFFGFGAEGLSVLKPMVLDGKEAMASMGSRRPLAILSRSREPLYSYFRQLFAQVTNPPIDPYRESLVMTLVSYIGRERNLLEEGPEHARQLKLSHPILTNTDLRRLREAELADFRICTVSTVFSVAAEPGDGVPAPGSRLKAALERLRTAAELKVDEGYSLIILSDRGVDSGHVSIPALLALSAVNRRLVEAKKRHMVGLVVETGGARDVHQIATLIGYGASAVNPWLVFEALPSVLPGLRGPRSLGIEEAEDNYLEAIERGLLKIMSKMGISTIASWRGAGLFEALGLSRAFVDEYFPGTASPLGGLGIGELESTVLERHAAAFGLFAADEKAGEPDPMSPAAGSAQAPWPRGAAALLRKAVTEGDESAYRAYSGAMREMDRPRYAIRDLFSLAPQAGLALEEVEAPQAIVARLSVAAMSCGALGPEAHEALAEGANSVGAWSCSGEGGEDEARQARDGGRSSSASRQIASGRFGVDLAYLCGAQELQIKVAQGAKPGEGGQLPGSKVDAYIARLRKSSPGVSLVSPPPHHDIYSIEDLSELIHDLRSVNPRARIAVKLAAQAGIGAVAAGVAKAGADCVVISSGDGGTGAAALSSIDHVGGPWELALPEVRQVLGMNGLKDRVVVQVDGRLRHGEDVVVAAILGAEEFAFGTAALLALGCVACGQCDKDLCPAGIATQKPELRARFAGEARHLGAFLGFVAEEVREILARLGLHSLEEAFGRLDLLDLKGRSRGGDEGLLDFARVKEALALARGARKDGAKALKPGLASFRRGLSPTAMPVLDARLVDLISGKDRPGEAFRIRNCDRSTGAALSGYIQGLSLAGEGQSLGGLPDGRGGILINFEGAAGQSFGAFLAPGISFMLRGEANDYLGKGLSGGRLILRPREASRYSPEWNVIAGNVGLFGATAGEAFICGRVGERFAVRNAGVRAVVEGAGDHACEYMTGGRVVVLGSTGVNFGAGMTGGVAYVLDEDQLFDTRCSAEGLCLDSLAAEEDRAELRALLEDHLHWTGSPRASLVLGAWEEYAPLFVRVSATGRSA